MEAAWAGPSVPLVADGDARSTFGNARAVAAAARRLDATNVTLVTSSWHRARAAALVRAQLDRSIRVDVVSPPPTRPLVLLGRELLCLVALPLQLAVRGRRSPARPPGP